MEPIQDIFKIDIKKFNIYTILSVIMMLAGILFWIYWGIRFGVWYDIGIYSIVIVLALPGFIGFLLSFKLEEEKEY